MSLREKSIDNHIGKANHDEDITFHEDELKASLIEEPIADPVPKDSKEKDTMSLITNQEGS